MRRFTFYLFNTFLGLVGLLGAWLLLAFVAFVDNTRNSFGGKTNVHAIATGGEDSFNKMVGMPPGGHLPGFERLQSTAWLVDNGTWLTVIGLLLLVCYGVLAVWISSRFYQRRYLTREGLTARQKERALKRATAHRSTGDHWKRLLPF